MRPKIVHTLHNSALAIAMAAAFMPLIVRAHEPPSNRTANTPETSKKPGEGESAEKSGEPDLSTGRVEFAAGASETLELKRAPTGHLLVRPVVNGVPAGWYIFDTGAGICCVSTPHVDELNLARAGSVDAKGVGGQAAMSLYRATTLQLGPVTLHEEPVMATDFSMLKQYLGEEIAGVIGFGLISSCVVELDLATPRIALFDPETYTLREGEWSELIIDDRIPVVHAKFEGHEGLFRLDTGANGTVTFHEPAVEKWKLLEGRESHGPLTDHKLGGVGGFVAGKAGTIDWFELGGVRHEKLPVTFALEAKGTFADDKKDGNIGGDLLRPFTLVLDYKHQRIAFVKRVDPR